MMFIKQVLMPWKWHIFDRWLTQHRMKKWSTQARAGRRDAYYHLAKIFEVGHTQVTPNLIKAYVYYRLANGTTLGDPVAACRRLEATMPSQDLQRTQQVLKTMREQAVSVIR